MSKYDLYETVVGLEVHAQLTTKSKLFCGDSTAFGAAPNTHVSPVTLALPGSLPKMNKKAIELAVKMGIACHCSILKENYFARKNYFYPDLPKGYQVSQHTTPICVGGFITIKTGDTEKRIRLNRIHMEEDAGKSIHDADPDYTCIDLNRAGVPLIEIVTEPDIRNGEEAFAYVNEIRKLVRYLGVCDGNMEEGSLRCDANISVRKKGDEKLGTKVEIKNLNSVRNIKKAIEYEARLMIDMLEANEIIIQQTKSYDVNKGITIASREKEDADDYRYFPDPDLSPFIISEAYIDEVKSQLPVLQEARIRLYTNSFHLPEYDAGVITDDRAFADYFEKLGSIVQNYKASANWMLGPVKSWLNEQNKDIDDFPLPAEQLARLIGLVLDDTLSFTIASSRIFPEMLVQPAADPARLARDKNLVKQSDAAAIETIIDQVLKKMPEKVKEYQKGKKGLIGLFVGEVMKLSNGKADPKITNRLLTEKLQSH